MREARACIAGAKTGAEWDQYMISIRRLSFWLFLCHGKSNVKEA